jgi:hypothetical protein
VAVIGRYRATQRPQFAVGAVDVLARALMTQGPFAPPAGTLDCVLLRRTAPAAREFDPPLVLMARQTPNGFLVLDGRYRVGDGPVRDTPLADGTYDAELRGAAFQTAPFVLRWPPATLRTPAAPNGTPIDLELLPAAGYPFPDVTGTPFNLGPTLIRGSVFTTAGDPVEGAAVSVLNLPALPDWPFWATRTGASGDWAVLLPDRRRIGFPAETPVASNPPVPPLAPAPMTIRIAYPSNGPVITIPNVPITLGRENTVPNTALRGRVVGPGSRPLADAAITTSVNALASRSRADGSWALYFDANQADANNVTVTATAPAGNSATAQGVAVKQRATVVVPTIHLG